MKKTNQSIEELQNHDELSYHSTSKNRISPIQQYQDMIIGNRKIFDLLRFELFTLLLMNMPSMIGLFLRQKLYKTFLGDVGRGAIIGIGVSLRQPKDILLGNKVVIDDLTLLSIRGKSSKLEIKDNVFFGRKSEIKIRNGVVIIGQNSSIGTNCKISTTDGKLTIGDYVFVAANCYIGGGNHIFNETNIPIALQGFDSKGGVIIGNDVWIGANCFIVDGVKIGDGAIIGACSMVNKDVPPYSIAYGIPARIVKYRK